MLKKLIKYEFKSSARLLVPINACLLLLSLVSRILIEIPIDNTLYLMFSGMLLGVSVILLFTSLTATGIICIVRYYQNYYTDEGYLMLTLPVSKNSLIISKIIVSLIFIFFNYICVVISGFFLLGFDNSVDVIQAIFKFLTNEVVLSSLTPKAIIFIIELIIMFIIGHIFSLLYGYASISLGQLLMPNHKIIGAFCSSFIFYICTATVSYGLMFVAMFFASFLNWDIENFSVTLLLLFFGGLILLYIVISAVYYFISKNILTKKLNI